MRDITIYTDGSWKRSGMGGGWSCLLVSWPHWTLLADWSPDTTISRMELTAVVTGLSVLTEPCRVHVVSDSTYVCDCINLWLKRWVKHNWVGANGNKIQNQDLLWNLARLMKIHHVTAHWTKSHTGRKTIDALGNACVDRFAQWGSDGRYIPRPDYEAAVNA